MSKISIAVIQACSLGITISFALPKVSEGDTYTTLYSFTQGSDGANPDVGVIVIGSKLYGTTTASYVHSVGFGTVYSLNTDGSGFQTIHTFNGDDGANPEDALTAVGSTLYGTTSGVRAGQGHNSDWGTVFAINPDGSGFQTLHQFTDIGSEVPKSGVTAVGSTLYGTTYVNGSVYSVGQNGSNFDTLQTFYSTGSDAKPAAGLTLVGSTLYGVTQFGGVNSLGSIFAMNTDGSNYHVLFSFNATTTGSQPVADLIQVGSELYGATNDTIFSIGLDGSNFKTLQNVGSTSALTLVGSTLYGTGQGGEDNIFSMNLDGSNFQVIPGIPAVSNAPLTLSGDTLYGTTVTGGAFGHGSVFSLTVPEPSAIALAALGGLAPLAYRRRLA